MPPDITSGLPSILQRVDMKYVWIIAGLVFLLILFYVFTHIARRAKNKGAGGLAMSFDDLDRMKKRGLLTDEELARVRGSLVRRMSEQESHGKTSLQELENLANASLTLKAGAESAAPQAAPSGVPPKLPPVPGSTRFPGAPFIPPAAASVSQTSSTSASAQPASMGQLLVELARQGKISKSDLEALRSALNAPGSPTQPPQSKPKPGGR
ncbi:MAG: hypothetical protein NTX50_10720 [Candidatus Sumerlaeota bacterium]|nr:hypothetical protein [Candidatus Sumerlaeota bacterium]